MGTSLGIVNMAFPEVVAGDPDRAAFAFFGSTTPGSNWNQADFPGVWYLYLSVTYDGGATWSTFNVTPNDPIQRGGICNGTMDTCRNLLDFFDATIDKEGRILIGYDDGCVGPCVDGGPNSFTAKAAIARQDGGKRMFAAFDPVTPALPGAPLVSASADDTGVTLTWPTPDDHGAAITQYKIYRGTVSNGETFLATAGTKGIYVDDTAQPGVTYYYRITAVNSIGEGPYCGEISPIVIPKPDPCTVPGVPILTDKNGDLVTATGVTSYPGYDLRSLSLAEPFGPTFVDKLVFTIKVESLLTVPPSARWPVQFRLPSDPPAIGRWVDMSSDAAGMVTFRYGTFNPTGSSTGGYGAPSTIQGNADAESTYDPNGTITIVISRSKIGNPAVGTTLQGFLIRVRIEPAGVTPDNMPDSLAGEGVYPIIGNFACRPNAKPIARLSANPQSGPAPLTTTLNASASSDPDSDPIVSYTFSFGDGAADVTQASPTIQHTYTNQGNFQARVRVKDARNAVSENAAVLMIDVGPGGGPPPPPSPTPSATPTATPTATPPPPSPTPTPTARPARLLNISSRLRVQTDDEVLIGGFIVTGFDPKKIILRAIGPSIKIDGKPFPGRLSDPMLEMYNGNGQLMASNDDWKQSNDRAEIEASGLAPTDDKESAIARTIDPGNYTAIVRGKDKGQGIGVVEAYDRNPTTDGKFGNISTRGLVQTGDNVLISGFIVGDQSTTKVLVRGLGPSLKPGLPTALDNPTLELFDQNGTSVAFNDNWKDAANRTDIEATGLAPTKDAESAILMTLPSTRHSAIVRGKDDTIGIALIEVYNVQ